MPVEAALGVAMTTLHRAAPFDEAVVAVSGGSDSMALLFLAHGWAQGAGVGLRALTVDHGLRPEAAAEAAFVAGHCARLGITHQTLRWDGWQGHGNLQGAAREARYALLAGAVAGSAPILLGHTADDQAETFLMRLARGSGVDGLAAMRADWRARGRRWARPLLAQRRDDLRDWLRAKALEWCDDPSNENNTFDRVKARKALALLAPMGLDIGRLQRTAEAMRVAREGLERASYEAARGLARIEAGDVVFDMRQFAGLSQEVRERLLAHALRWVSGAPYRPRRAALRRLADDLAAPGRATLHGCLVSRQRGALRIGREPAAIAGNTVAAGALWDNRWDVSGPAGDGAIAALGEAGLRQCPDWRATGLQRSTLLVTPAIWSAPGGQLIAAPLAGCRNGWRARLRPATGDFFTSILSH